MDNAAGDLPADYYLKGQKVLVTLEEQIDPKHTALIVIDVQNDYIYGKGNTSAPPGRTDPRQEMLKPLNSFIDKCRSMSIPVIYTFTVHAGDLDLPPYKAPKIRTNTAPVCMRGTRGGEFPDKLNKPLPGEPVVTKHGYDAFMDHDLHTILQNRGIKTLIFTGIDTGICVDSTLRHGFHLGYYVVLAENATVASDAARHAAACKLIGAYYGFITSTSEIEQIWDRVK